jgi:cation:H+ antiporter
VNTTLNMLQLGFGLALLYWGAEWLIRGSSSLARTLGVKPLVIGLTVVAYGTSAPELAVSTRAALDHHQPIALGNVIGSCIANISLILGLTALISPPTIDRRIIRREVPILVGSVIAVPLFLMDGVISRNEGLILLACAALFTIVSLTVSARLDEDSDHTAEEAGSNYGGRARPRAGQMSSLLMSALGLALLLFGSGFFVGGARGIASEAGMSERMLGLTIIALGTSLPELATCTIAAARGHATLAVGSVIGANLLNVFLVLGVVAYLRPIRVGERMHGIDLIGLIVITLLGVIMLRGSRRISRPEGGLLIAAYVGFIVAATYL